MTKKIKFAYCNTCKQEVESSARKPIGTMKKVLWGIAMVGTLGIAAIGYAFYLSNRPKIYCPTCFTKLEYSDKPFVKPKKERKDMTPKEKVLDKVGIKEEVEEEELPKKKSEEKKKKKEEISKEKKTVCPYCGATLDKEYDFCPFCQVALKS